MRRLVDLRWRLRRWWFLTVVRLQARSRGSSIDLDVAPDARFGPRVRISVDRGTRNRFSLGPHVVINADVAFLLHGGSVRMGEGVVVRRGSSFNVAGDLELAGGNVLSFFNVIHCAERIRLGPRSCTNEFVSLIDSTHYHDGGHEFFYENTRTKPIEVGADVWIGNKSSVLLGVTIGDGAVVAAHSVVNRPVPERATVSGVPARVIMKRPVAPASGPTR